MKWSEVPWEARAAIPAFMIGGILPIVGAGWRIGGLLSPWTAIACGWAAGAMMHRLVVAKGWKPTEPLPSPWTRQGALGVAASALFLDLIIAGDEFQGTTRTVLIVVIGIALVVAAFSYFKAQSGY